MSRSRESYEKGLVSSRLAKQRRTGRCEVCGAVTRYGGAKGNPVSKLCASHANQKWTREKIIRALNHHRSVTGETPSSREWLLRGRPAYAPTTTTVRAVFGTWTAAIRAAGLPPRTRKRR